MSLETDIALLRQVPTFDSLNAEAVRILAISSEHRQIAAGDVLFKAGDPADCGYVLVSGRLEFVKDMPDGTRRMLQAVRPGALVGEMALILANKRPATLVAVTPSVVMRLTRSTFLRTLEGFPEAAERLRAVFAARLDDTLGALDQVREKLENSGVGPRRR